jgi:hypothetical protein
MASDLADRIIAVVNAEPDDIAGKLPALNECIARLLMRQLGDDQATAQIIAESLVQRLMERIGAGGVNSEEFRS